MQLNDYDINEKDSDINKLRETVFNLLNERLSIDWKPMLVVEVSQSRSRLFDKKLPADTLDTEHDANGSLSIDWERWQVATFNGNKLSRPFGTYYKPHHFSGTPKEEPREVWNRAGEGWPCDDEDDEPHFERRQKAMIPDTPQNRLALEAVADKLQDISERLRFLFSGNKIEETLSSVASMELARLPAPVPKKITKRKSKR